VRTRGEDLLLGEWCCLGLLAVEPAHGFALARRLAPTGDLGRIWSVSRPLTYRALSRLLDEGLIESIGQEPGVAGGDRTVYRPTRGGRSKVRRWLRTPVSHVRDVRSELLVKLELCRLLDVDRQPLVTAQRDLLAGRASRTTADTDDPVTLWREESLRAVLAFLDRLDEVQRPK
jgi:DNA-binding PadR family transcriptional regulator